MRSRLAFGIGTVVAPLVLSSCSLIELSGTMTKKTGEVMTDYSQKNDGIIAKGAGFGGRVNTAVGGAVENVARKGVDPKQSKTGQAVDAGKQVTTAAVDSVSPDKNAAGSQIQQAQRRLKELGYDVGRTDGVMGSKTKVALGRFQASEGLAVSYQLDSATLTALGVANGR